MRKILNKYFFITLGAVIVGLTIEGFLVPNKIIDGGILGISIMAAYITETVLKLPISLGAFTFALNFPFLVLAFKRMGARFICAALYAVTVMSVTIYAAEHIDGFSKFTEAPILAALFGGIFLGVGVGLVLKNFACLDGTEVLAIMLTKKTGYSIGEIIMFINIFIFIIAGFVYSPDHAMYSILAYYFAYKTMDAVIEGLNESRAVWVISGSYREIGDRIIKEFDTSVTYIPAFGGYSNKEKMILYCITSRIEIGKLKELIKEMDPAAFISVENVHEVEGVRVKKNKHI